MSEFQIFPNNEQKNNKQEDTGDRLYTVYGKHDFIDDGGFPRVESADNGKTKNTAWLLNAEREM